MKEKRREQYKKAVSQDKKKPEVAEPTGDEELPEELLNAYSEEKKRFLHLVIIFAATTIKTGEVTYTWIRSQI